MKYLKDLNLEPLKINELEDYADLKGINLEQELKEILINGVENLYKKIVPKDRQSLIEHKLTKQKKSESPKKIINSERIGE